MNKNINVCINVLNIVAHEKIFIVSADDLWYPQAPGPRLNIKDRLSRYGDSHVKDKTAGRTSYL